MNAFSVGATALLLCSWAPLRAQTPPEALASSGTVPSEPVVTLTALGDIRLDGPVWDIVRRDGPAAPTEGLRSHLAGDILLGNLEAPLTRRGKKTPGKTWTFRSPPENLVVLTTAGFTAVGLANNHVMDYGPEGLEDTLETLDKAGIRRTGAGRDLPEALRPVVISTRGVRVGILALTSTFPEEAWARPGRPGVAFSDPARMSRAIRELRPLCDALVVSFHGGTELADSPNPIQRTVARAAVDAGADLVIGHHPHVVQAVEVYRGKVILHSLGNSLFVSPTPTTRWAVLARATLSRAGVARVDLVPFDTGYGRLRTAPAEGRSAVLSALDKDGALTANPDLLRFLPEVPR